MTYEEIKAAMQSLVQDMMAKGVKQPDATLEVTPNRNGQISLWCDMDVKVFDGDYLKIIRASTPEAMIDAARTYIATLPDPANEGERKFTRALAGAVDIATEYALLDAVVSPVKQAIREVNAALLSAPK